MRPFAGRRGAGGAIAGRIEHPHQTGSTMSVDETTVRRVAKLARIRITDEEAATLQGELNGILGWIEQLGEVDVEGVEPMTSVVRVEPRLREDAITDGEKADAVTANAPASEDHFFAVPKVVE